MTIILGTLNVRRMCYVSRQQQNNNQNCRHKTAKLNKCSVAETLTVLSSVTDILTVIKKVTKMFLCEMISLNIGPAPQQ